MQPQCLASNDAILGTSSGIDTHRCQSPIVTFRVFDEPVSVPATARRCRQSLLATMVDSCTAVPIRRNAEGEIPVTTASSVAAFRLLACFLTEDACPAEVFNTHGAAVITSSGHDADSALEALRQDAEYFLGSTTDDTDFVDFMQNLQCLAQRHGVSRGSLLCPPGLSWTAHSAAIRPDVSRLHEGALASTGRRREVARPPVAPVLPLESRCAGRAVPTADLCSSMELRAFGRTRRPPSLQADVLGMISPAATSSMVVPLAAGSPAAGEITRIPPLPFQPSSTGGSAPSGASAAAAVIPSRPLPASALPLSAANAAPTLAAVVVGSPPRRRLPIPPMHGGYTPSSPVTNSVVLPYCDTPTNGATPTGSPAPAVPAFITPTSPMSGFVVHPSGLSPSPAAISAIPSWSAVGDG